MGARSQLQGTDIRDSNSSWPTLAASWKAITGLQFGNCLRLSQPQPLLTRMCYRCDGETYAGNQNLET